MRWSLFPIVFLLVACQPGSPPADTADRAMVAAANPYAVEAGTEMLRRGGSAVDAAIAAHAVLGLVEPQSSGIGGGGFILTYDAAESHVIAFDGRETAPSGAHPEMFLDDEGTPFDFIDRVQSGRAIGVPSTIALYRAAHDRYGRLPWSDLFGPAIALAEEGFEVSPRLNELLERISRFTRIDEDPVTAAYFFPDGEPLPVGSIRRNADYAATLRRVARDGPAGFYEGPVAAAIVEAVAAPPLSGHMSPEDLAAYRVILREPVCGPYRDYRVCSMPPPSSGVAVIQILGLLERLTPDGVDDDATGWGAFIDAMKLGYADRDHYVADADFVPIPVEPLLDPRYLDARSSERAAADVDVLPGDPGVVLGGEPLRPGWALERTPAATGTTHLSVVDGDGNAVAFTASVEFPFGAQRMVAGFLLNNQLTDFSARPSIDGLPVANAAAAGKRPRSSMTPTLVFDADDRLFMVTGSPGGNSIIAYTLKSLLGVIDFGLDAQAAVELPNVIARTLPVQVEEERAGAGFIDGLRALGYPIEARGGENSGLHTIVVGPDRLDGGADPRREGTVGWVP